MNRSQRPRENGLRRYVPVAVVLGLLAVALLRIASTYRVFNETYDEPAHLAAGMEWLDHGTYEYEPKHPPMRAVFAIGPRLLGLHYSGAADMLTEGHQILYANGEYWRNLTAARVAALPFFALTVWMVFVWARRLAGPLAGVFAALAYSTLPLALGHAGVVANDTLLAATLTVAMFAWARWLENPGSSRAMLFGMAAAAAVFSKLSAIPFLGIIVGVTGALWLLGLKAAGPVTAPRSFVPRLRIAVRAALLALVAFCALLWAGYRFSSGPIIFPQGRPHDHIDKLVGSSGPAHDLAYRVVELPVPAPDLLRGVQAMLSDNYAGRAAFFMGKVRGYGSPEFFPVGILIKTPIPFLLLMLAGAVMLVRRAWRDGAPLALLPPLAALLIVLVLMPSTINIGVRHVLPAFPLLAICAGVAAAALWQMPALKSRAMRWLARGALVLLLGWQLLAGVRVHPDYLAYFNECCASAPQEWMINSDLDWGQDLARLSDELRRRGVAQVHIAYFGTADLDRHGLPPHTQLLPFQHVSGWVAVSEFRLTIGSNDPPYDGYQWLLRYQPVTEVGKSMRLYWIP